MKNKLDYILFTAVIILSIFGIIMIYSASSIWAEYKFNDSFHYLKYQSIFFIIGVIVMLIVSKIDYKIYYDKANIILLICTILLILVLIPGIGSVRNGSRSWFGIGSLGIQPSEFAKLGMIIFTSKYLTNSNKFLKSYKQGVFPILGILFFLFGLIMLQPDMGTGAILVVSIIVLLFTADSLYAQGGFRQSEGRNTVCLFSWSGLRVHHLFPVADELRRYCPVFPFYRRSASFLFFRRFVAAGDTVRLRIYSERFAEKSGRGSFQCLKSGL